MTQAHEELERLQIRLARDEDRLEIYSLHTQAIRRVSQERYSPEQLEEWLGKQASDYLKPIDGRSIYVALIASRIIAFGHLEKKSSDDSQYEVKALFVHPSYTRQGIGKKIYRVMEDIAISRGSKFIVVKSSLNGEEFYKANGFLSGEIGRMPGSVHEFQYVNMAKQLDIF